MKKFITICLVLLLCASTSYAVVRTDARDSRNSIESKIDGLSGSGRGTSWYVYSGASGSGSGSDWTNACLTIEAAIGKASAYDTINVGQAHNEAITTADNIDADKAGLYIKGHGRGSAMPTLDYDAAAGEFVIGADNVRVENIRFRTSFNDVTTAVDIEAGSDGTEFVGCKFGYSEAVGTDEFISAITVAAATQYTLVEDCYFNAGAAGASQAITFSSVSGIKIKNSEIVGDYGIACVKNAAGGQDVVIENSTLFNGIKTASTTTSTINTEPAIELHATTGAYIAHNDIISDVATALLMHVADAAVFMDNYVSDQYGDDHSGTRESGTTVPLGTTATTTTISGHIDG